MTNKELDIIIKEIQIKTGMKIKAIAEKAEIDRSYLSTTINDAVPTTMAVILTHAIILMAFVDFGALKYRQAKRRFKEYPPFLFA